MPFYHLDFASIWLYNWRFIDSEVIVHAIFKFFCHGIHISAIDMGLSRVRPVADMLGITAWGNNRDGDTANQQITAHVFMVAGTNGKGSTTATIAQICQ